jgi:hypothetical protein
LLNASSFYWKPKISKDLSIQDKKSSNEKFIQNKLKYKSIGGGDIVSMFKIFNEWQKIAYGLSSV